VAVQVTWKEQPDTHDYPAATSYRTLLLAVEQASVLVEAIVAAPIETHKAKDILRVRGRLGSGIPLQIADGYHRVCASYHVDENTDIPCCIAELP